MEFILVPGAWAGAWLWDDVATALRQEGHSVHQLTLTGLEKEVNPDAVHLKTHVDDVQAYIHDHNLESVILVGHSYSGIVVGQVASQNQDIIKHTIFVEAFLPVSGCSLLKVSGLDVKEEKEAIANNNGFWPAPTPEELESQPKLSNEQKKLLASKQCPHPGNTVTEPAKLSTPLAEISATFIAREDWLADSRESGLIEQLKGNEKWNFRSIDGGHWPMLTIPRQLSELIIAYAV